MGITSLGALSANVTQTSGKWQKNHWKGIIHPDMHRFPSRFHLRFILKICSFYVETYVHCPWHIYAHNYIIMELFLSRHIVKFRYPSSIKVTSDAAVNIINRLYIVYVLKHCQRHNGPEGWVHITRSQCTVHKTWTCYNFKISTKHQLKNLNQTSAST